MTGFGMGTDSQSVSWRPTSVKSAAMMEEGLSAIGGVDRRVTGAGGRSLS